MIGGARFIRALPYVVAGVAALVGLVPVRAGVQRVHLMSALLVPILASGLSNG